MNKMNNTPTGYKHTEIGILPEDWEAVPLGAVADVIDGDRGTHYPSKGDLLSNGECLFLNAGNVTKNGFKFIKNEFINKEKHKLLNNGTLQRYDIILTTRGTVGNFAFFSDNIIFNTIRINSGMVIIRSNLNILSPSYLYNLFKSFLFSNQIIKLSFGSAQPQLTVKSINNLIIFYPPTHHEQEKIATALSDVDDYIVSLEKLIEKKSNIKQGAMQRLLNPFDDNGKVKEGWSFITYDQAFYFLTTATYSRSELGGNGAFCVHYGDIHTKFKTHVDITKTTLPSLCINKIKTYPLLKNGDLIMADASEDYEGVGKSFEISNIENHKIISGLHTFLLRPKTENFVNGFKGYIHVMNYVQEQFKRKATGLKVYGVSKSNLRDILIPCPPPPQQIAIAQILSDMDSEIESLEIKLSKVKNIKQGMMQKLLTGQIRLVKPCQETRKCA